MSSSRSGVGSHVERGCDLQEGGARWAAFVDMADMAGVCQLGRPLPASLIVLDYYMLFM
jgi:hypothetical protein